MAKIQITMDKNKAHSLYVMANLSYKRLMSLSVTNFPSNTIIDFYDIFHKLLDAIFLTKGIKFIGNGAHFELINESNMVCTQEELQFLQKLREIRNDIQYDGFMVESAFVERNMPRLKALYNKLSLLVVNLL